MFCPPSLDTECNGIYSSSNFCCIFMVAMPGWFPNSKEIPAKAIEFSRDSILFFMFWDSVISWACKFTSGVILAGPEKPELSKLSS